METYARVAKQVCLIRPCDLQLADAYRVELSTVSAPLQGANVTIIFVHHIALIEYALVDVIMWFKV